MIRSTREFVLGDEAETARLAGHCAGTAMPGDIFLLRGEIGAGKSTFARAFIRARLGNPVEEVPSPTFTIVQTYEHPGGDIWHCDLYRLGDAGELAELGLDEAFDDAICLIEWPDRLGDVWPETAITAEMAAQENGHRMRLDAPADTIDRLVGRYD